MAGAIGAVVASCGGKIVGQCDPGQSCLAGDGGIAPPIGVDVAPPRPIPPKPIPDAYPPPPTPTVCPTPADVTGFMPSAFVSPTPPSNACSPAQVQGLWESCYDGQTASAGNCQTFANANKTCMACAATQRADATWGPLVIGAGLLELNIAGCVALQGDMTCATAMEQHEECNRAACESQCPVLDQQSYQDYMKCVQLSDNQGCKKYTLAADNSCGSSPAAKACGSPLDYKTGYFKLVPMFCSAGG